jgi:20S proteasome subunit beta 7
MYARRNKGNPLWNTLLVAGFRDGAATLGYIDSLGTAFCDDFSATGFGSHLALPIIRSRWRADMGEAEARTLLEDCLRVLWYRDTKALNKIQVATVSAAGVAISAPYSLEAKWDYKAFVQPKAGIDTGGSW